MLVSICISAYAQTTNEVQIGSLTNGKLSFSNEQFLLNYFDKRLKNDGVLGDREILYSPDRSNLFVVYKVIGNSQSVTCIGITLKVFNGIVYILNEKSNLLKSGINIGGGSVEISCTGNPCNSCFPSITSWAPFLAQCKCYQPNCSTCKCDMTATTTVNISL
jgi:hypothetical protein